MEEMQKKIGRRMSVMMGLTISFILSLVGILMSGHFTIVKFLMSFAMSAIISLIIGFIVPMKKVSDAACSKLKLTLGTFLAKAITSLISSCIYTPIIVLAMITMAFTQANTQIDKEIANTQKEMDTIQQQISEASQGDLAKIGQLSGKKVGLTEKMKSLQNSKPSFAPMFFRSLGVSMVLSFLISFIMQPIYLKLTFKHFKIEA